MSRQKWVPQLSTCGGEEQPVRASAASIFSRRSDGGRWPPIVPHVRICISDPPRLIYGDRPAGGGGVKDKLDGTDRRHIIAASASLPALLLRPRPTSIDQSCAVPFAVRARRAPATSCQDTVGGLTKTVSCACRPIGAVWLGGQVIHEPVFFFLPGWHRQFPPSTF